MPTYEYRCPNGHDFDHFFRKISDAQGAMLCPVCGATAERRMSAGAGLVFKGSGFYITDYGKDGKKQERAAEKGAAAPNQPATSSGESKDASSAGTGTGDGGGSDRGGSDRASNAESARRGEGASERASDRASDRPGDRASERGSDSAASAPRTGAAAPTPKSKPTDSE
jgi:putative FmdB family regulatory protein